MRPRTACSGLLLLASCSVTSYSTAIDEFDSITGWKIPEEEPVSATYPDQSLQYPWYSMVLPLEGAVGSVENPSGFVRERVAALSEHIDGDLTRVAQVTRRLLWVADKDPNPFNRIMSLQGIERVMRALAIDPLDQSWYSRELDPQAQAENESRYSAAQETLGRLFRRPDRSLLSAEERRDYVAALSAYTTEPLPHLRRQRALVRAVWSVWAVEADPEVNAAARRALERALGFAACNGLRDGLVPQEVEENFPAVRAEAIRIYRRLGGVEAVPFLLHILTRPQAGLLPYRYDQDVQNRRILVRMCAQLKLPLAMRSYSGGARPIEFLYESAVDESEDESVRLVALEGLWRCLATELRLKVRPEDDDWAREWWRKYVVERSR